MYYDGGHNLRIALHDRWRCFASGKPDPSTYEKLAAREFRIDPVLGGPWARYADAAYGNLSADPNGWTLSEPVRWTEYTGVSPYQDLDLSSDNQGQWSATRTRRYLGTAAEAPLDPNGTANDALYNHGDLIGSTVLTTDDAGAAAERYVYTAFGELVVSGSVGGDPSAGNTRYQYAGAYGYESGLLALAGTNPNLAPITLQHLGHRWYQPDIGRFVQRDPIGLAGGLNVYIYAAAAPTALIDSDGTWFRIFIRMVRGIWRVFWGSPVHHARKGKDILVVGPGSRRKAKRIAEEAWGKDIVHHGRPADGRLPHYQPRKNRKKVHIFYDILDCIFPFEPLFMPPEFWLPEDVLNPTPPGYPRIGSLPPV